MKLLNKSHLKRLRGIEDIGFQWYMMPLNSGEQSFEIIQVCFHPNVGYSNRGREERGLSPVSVTRYIYSVRGGNFMTLNPKPEDKYVTQRAAQPFLEHLRKHYKQFNAYAAQLALKHKAWLNLWQCLKTNTPFNEEDFKIDF